MGKSKVIYIGEETIVSKPMVIEDEWIVPKGWVALDDSLDDRPVEIYNRDGEVINVLEHSQILHISDGVEYRISIIKTDKVLNPNDEITY